MHRHSSEVRVFDDDDDFSLFVCGGGLRSELGTGTECVKTGDLLGPATKKRKRTNHGSMSVSGGGSGLSGDFGFESEHVSNLYAGYAM